MEFRKHPIFVVFTGFIIAIGRYLMKTIDDIYIYNYVNLIFMAVVNYIAIGIVILFVHSGGEDKCEKKINSSGLDTEEKRRRIKIIRIISFIIILVYLGIGLLYVIKFKSSDLNDAISIVALSLSISTSDLIDLFGKIYWNICSLGKK